MARSALKIFASLRMLTVQSGFVNVEVKTLWIPFHT